MALSFRRNRGIAIDEDRIADPGRSSRRPQSFRATYGRELTRGIGPRQLRGIEMDRADAERPVIHGIGKALGCQTEWTLRRPAVGSLG